MRHLLLIGGLAMALAGCKSNPYCLNCGNSNGGGNGDLAGQGDLAGIDFATKPIDMAGMNGDGGCVVTNNGVEICDGVDNDCNGIVDDKVDPAKLLNDPNNCGMCGKSCDYSATHQFGACTNGVCMPSGCTPGFVDADGNAANGCEYQCTPTVPPTEVCDGLDNNCNGQIDEGFTTTYNTSGKPNYDSDINNCGGCGFVCNLAGAVNKCGVAMSGKGVCQVDHCINNPGVDTFKHDMTKGDINTVGCEYHCPTASSTAGDCNASGGGGCVFPAEVCNGADDDCNFAVDDNLTDPDLNMPCGDKCPGGLVANCRGQCTAGTKLCTNGVKLCMGGTGPGPELCDGFDNNCDGQVDEPFTSPAPFGFLGGDTTKPLYNSDATNCGGCTKATNPNMYNGVCQLQHAVNGCHSAAANLQGNCFVASCNAGFNYAPKTDANKAAPTCGVVSAARDSTAGNVATGVGCFYQCSTGFSPPLVTCAGCVPSATEAVCDGKDNNCDGCIDNGLSAPNGLCNSTGKCATPVPSPIPIVCKGPSGWKCNYAAVAGLDVDGSGNLAAIETKCDGLDNNCNGYCDENFPTVATPNSVAQCAKNPGRVAADCSSGQGLCQQTGKACCGPSDGTCSDPPAGPFGVSSGLSVVCSKGPNLAAAQDEICDGIDQNCNGLIDDPNPANGHTGYRDTVVLINNIPADNGFGGVGLHNVYIYPYEASRPDSTGSSPGGLSTRACSKPSVIPWSNVTEVQAQAACAAAGGRLCTALEWQVSCEGPGVSPTPRWSLSVSPSAYPNPNSNPPGGVCNDFNQASLGPPPSPHAVWATGSAGRVVTQACFTDWTGGNHLSDMSGNVMEWTKSNSFTYQSQGFDGSISFQVAGRMRLTSATLATAGIAVGDPVFIGLSPTATHNGTFAVAAVVNGNTLDLTNSAVAGNFATENNLFWEAKVQNTYFDLRGGSYSSPSGGTTCEFNFDVAKASFANADIGFRCCFDKKPCASTADCGGAACVNGLCP